MMNIFSFPETCHSGEDIKKGFFADNRPLTPGDRREYRAKIQKMDLSYLLDAERGVTLAPQQDGEHKYDCLGQLEVMMKTQRGASDFAELCHRMIPHPLVVVLCHESSIMLSMAEKRSSRDGSDQAVLEYKVSTAWHDADQLDAFRALADYGQCHAHGFKDLYLHYCGQLEALNCWDITGKWPNPALDGQKRRGILEEIREIDRRLASLKAQGRGESQLARLVELNTQANSLRQRRGELCRSLTNG